MLRTAIKVHTSMSAIHFLASVSSPATVGNTYKSHRRRKSTIVHAYLTTVHQ